MTNDYLERKLSKPFPPCYFTTCSKKQYSFVKLVSLNFKDKHKFDQFEQNRKRKHIKKLMLCNKSGLDLNR